MWIVDAKSTTSSLQLRHLRQRHPSLPTCEEQEHKLLDQLQNKGQGPIQTPFSLANENSISTR